MKHELKPISACCGCVNRKQINIHIGQMHVSREPAVIYTLLGSCVAVCLFDPVARTGGMNHILMPGPADPRHSDQACRYGDHAIAVLLKRLLQIGAERKRVVAKVFGGAHMFREMPIESSPGLKNAETAVAFLNQLKIRIVKQDLGGYLARKVFFYTDSGDVFLKRLRQSAFSLVGC